MTTASDLIEKLEAQLAARKADGEYIVESFDVWHGDNDFGAADADIIRVERNTWNWGHCRSETCSHNSHDPYSEGDTVFVRCKKIGNDEHGRQMYALPNGRIFVYVTGHNHGYHFAPTARLDAYSPED